MFRVIGIYNFDFRAAYSKILRVHVSSEDADMAIILLQKQIKGKKKKDTTKTSAQKNYFLNSGKWTHYKINKGGLHVV
jgi:hypothetical protein